MSSPTNGLQCDKGVRHRQVNVKKSNYDKFWSVRINRLEAQLGKKSIPTWRTEEICLGWDLITQNAGSSLPLTMGPRLQTVGMSLDCMGLGDFSHSPKEGCKSLPKSVKDKISSLWQGDCCPPLEADTSSPLHHQRLANNCSSSSLTSGMGKTSWAKYRNLFILNYERPITWIMSSPSVILFSLSLSDFYESILLVINVVHANV